MIMGQVLAVYTEPYLRFIAEATHRALLEEKVNKAKAILAQFIPA